MSHLSLLLFVKHGRKLALFTRLNRQGLLEEIERKQAQLSSLLAGPQQKTVEKIREINQELAINSLSDSRRKDLNKKKEELEKKLYRLLPEIKPRIVEVNQVAEAIPSNGFLIEYQRYQKYNSKKPDLESWDVPFYLALVLKSNGEISSFDLGPASLIEEKSNKH